MKTGQMKSSARTQREREMSTYDNLLRFLSPALCPLLQSSICIAPSGSEEFISRLLAMTMTTRFVQLFHRKTFIARHCSACFRAESGMVRAVDRKKNSENISYYSP